jgi:hypothetical protein
MLRGKQVVDERRSARSRHAPFAFALLSSSCFFPCIVTV